MSWFVLSLLSGLFFALARVIARLKLRDGGDTLAFTAVHDFIAGLVLVPFIFYFAHFPTQAVTWVYFAGIVLFAFLADWLAFVALRDLDVSLYQIVNQVRHIFVLFGGLLVFHEAITTTKVWALLFIVCGVIIALYEKARFHLSRGVLVTIASTLAAVIAFFFAKETVKDFSEVAAASFELMLIGVLSIGLLRFNPKKIKAEIRLQGWWLIVAGAVFGLFELTLFAALRTGEISRVIPVTQSSLIFAVLIGILFLKERTRVPQKIAGAVMVIVGILLMSYL